MADFSSGKLIPVGNDIYEVSYGDDKGIYVEFYHREVENEKKSLQEGRPIYESREYIKIVPIGDKTKVIDRPVKKVPDAGVPSDLQRWPRQWQAFLNQETQVTEGTPITEWPAITRADAMSLKSMNIHTIEMLANLGDNNLTWLGARAMREKAKAWIEKAKTGVDSLVWAKEKAEMQAQIEALKNQLNGFASVGAIPEPKKRGRKPKVKDEQDTSTAYSGGE